MPPIESITITPFDPAATPAITRFDVDWRNRFGANWVTGVRDQLFASSCWAFASVGLVESAVRIQHNMWAVLSEGDLRDGWSNITSQPPVPTHGAGLGDALRHAKDAGIADPGCWPWSPGYSGYHPTSDRSGRTVRLGDLVPLSGDDAIRNWLRDRGPVAAHITFEASGSGGSLYGNSGAIITDTGVTRDQLHDVLVIGYSDGAGCWLIKNSWGTGWGNGGYGLISYGSCQLGSDEAFGLDSVSPDPWTKRRLHSGCLAESGAGAFHRNFELINLGGTHAWRAGGEGGSYAWDSNKIVDNATGSELFFFSAPAMTLSTWNRNIEVVGLIAGQLRHWWFDVAAQQWHQSDPFGNGIDGAPGLIESDYGVLEVVVRDEHGQLVHLWRDGSGAWQESARFGSGVRASGPAFIQSSFGQARRNFEVVCVLDDGRMQHWWRNNDDPAMPWQPTVTFGSGAGNSGPCLIQSEYGRQTENSDGNLELVAAAGGRAQHWWRSAADGQWRQTVEFGDDVQEVEGLVYSSWGNLEVIATRSNDRRLYWRDGNGWHDGGAVPA